MGVGKFALTALKWIGRVVGVLQTPAGKVAANAIFGYVLGEKAPKYMARLDKIERTIGAHTSVWNKVKTANAKKAEITLSYEEVRYLFMFKKAWDEHIREPLKQLAAKINK